MGKTRKNHFPHLMTIIEDREIPDGAGGSTVIDSAAGSTMAAIWPIRSREVRENMREEVEVTHNIRIRYQARISHKNRLHWGDRKFKIEAIVNPDEKNVFLDLVCNEQF